MKKETWKYLKRYNKKYKISNLGNFKTCIGNERKLNVYYGYDGFGRVHLSPSTFKQEQRLAHVLVFENFGNQKRKKDYVIIHKDGIRRNNKRSNLKQIKKGENMKGIINKRRKEKYVTIKDSENYFNTTDLAFILGCTVQWVIQLIWMKKIIAIKAKTIHERFWRYQIHKKEVQKLLNNKK